MARYGLGQPVRLSTTVKDATGALVNAGTLSLTVKKPDATTQTYASPTNDGTGLYHQDVPAADLTQLGRYAYVWTATGAGAGVSGPAGFDVFDPFEVTVISLQDAHDALDKTSVTDDAEIMRMVATIEANLEKTTGGPIITRTISNERLEVGSGYRTLTVRYRPLVSVTSIVDVASGAAVSLTDLDIDTATGIIRRKLQLPFWSRGPFYLVTYTAGLGVAVPPAVEEAALIILQHLWETQRGQSSAPHYGGEEEQVTLPGWGFAVPNRAAELLSPYALEVYV